MLSDDKCGASSLRGPGMALIPVAADMTGGNGGGSGTGDGGRGMVVGNGGDRVSKLSGDNGGEGDV